MIATPDIDRIIGAEAVDTDGDKIGKVSQVYVDAETESPTWASVKTGLFGMSETLVPLDNASWDQDVLHVGVDKARVKDAPRVDPDAEISPEEQQRLYSYYGLSHGGGGSDGGFDRGTDSGFDRSGSAGSTETAGSDRTDRNRFAADRDDTADRRGTTGYDTSGPTTDDAMTRSEERLDVGKEQVQTGRARLRKYVVTEQQRVDVPVSREEVRIEREPITDGNVGSAMNGPDLSDEEHEIVLNEERPVINKETVPVERVRLGKEQVTENRQVNADVSREEITTDGDGFGDRNDGSRR
jgi:uncharacterized protein (TIGR02271 family)